MTLSGDLNPHWFGHPASTTIYLTALTHELIYKLGRLSGHFADWRDYRDLYLNDPTLFFWLPRMITVLFGSASVFLIYAIATNFTSSVFALLAALFFTVSPSSVHFATQVRPDVQLTFWILLAVWFSINIAKTGRIRDYIAAG
jgi:dolichyl-phosphate-mannose--protein O-mannosyl transferase